MSELTDLNYINQQDEERSLLNDAKMMDEALVNKLNKEETCKCVWCGIEQLKSDMITVDNIYLCKVCNKKLLEKK